MLNTIVAEAFSEAADILEQAEDFEPAVKSVIADLMTKHERIIFNGNGYSEQWVKEAKRRGLPVMTSMVDAVPALTTRKSVELFEKFHVFTQAELESRAEIMYETYVKIISIEAQTMIHMASKRYIPAIIRYTTNLAGSIGSVQSICPEADVSVQKELLVKTSHLLKKAQNALSHMEADLQEIHRLEDVCQMANQLKNRVVPGMKELRGAIDALELIVDKELWPVPTYGDLMFEV